MSTLKLNWLTPLPTLRCRNLTRDEESYNDKGKPGYSPSLAAASANTTELIIKKRGRMDTHGYQRGT